MVQSLVDILSESLMKILNPIMQYVHNNGHTHMYNLKIYNLYCNIKKNNISPDNKQLAKIFEYYSAIQLSQNSDSQFLHYDDIDPTFKEENSMSAYDTGIDLCNLTNSIVQCKLRKNNLTYKECSTFFASQNAHDGTKYYVRWTDLIIARNSDSSLSENLANRHFTDIQYNKEDMLNYCDNLYNNPPSPELKEKDIITIRDYQTESIKIINNSGNCILKLPTGTGKSIIAIEYFKLNKNKKYLFLVPFKPLLFQFKEEILNYSNFTEDQIQIIGDGYNIFDAEKNITISTYNSINIFKEYHSFFYKIFVDEAHHFYTPVLYKNDDEESDQTEEKETFYETIRKLRKYNNSVYLSATIDPIEGFVYFKKDIRDMIQQNYLCDYTIKIPLFSKGNTLIHKCEYLQNNHANTIIYCANITDAKQFYNTMESLRKNSTGYIDCDTKTKKRNEYIKNFKNGNLLFLVNVNTLTEGLNAQIAKSVYLHHMPSSKTKIIQITGRILRKHPDKTFATVILPFSCEDNETDISNFLKILSKNDPRIKKSYESKKTGGYISFEKNIEEKNEEENEEENEVEFLYDKIYNSIGTLLNTNEILDKKFDMWFEYVVANGKFMPKSYIEDEVKLGKFQNALFGALSGGNQSYKNNIEGWKKKIKDNATVKKLIDDKVEELKNKRENKTEISTDEKFDMWFEYVVANGKFVLNSYIEDEVKLGIFQDALFGALSGRNQSYKNNIEGWKKKIKDNATVKKLIDDKVEELKNKRENKTEISTDEKFDMWFEYVVANGKFMPKSYIEDEVKLGKFQNALFGALSGGNQSYKNNIEGWKKKIKDNATVKKLIDDKVEELKNKRENKTEISTDEKFDMWFEYVVANGKFMLNSYIEDEVKLGIFQNKLFGALSGRNQSYKNNIEGWKKKIKDNATVKKLIDDKVEELKNKRENRTKISTDEKFDMWFEYVVANGKFVPQSYIEDEVKLGIFQDTLFGALSGRNQSYKNNIEGWKKKIKDNATVKKLIDDKVEELKNKRENKTEISTDEKFDMWFEYVVANGKFVPQSYIEDEVKLGIFQDTLFGALSGRNQSYKNNIEGWKKKIKDNATVKKLIDDKVEELKNKRENRTKIS